MRGLLRAGAVALLLAAWAGCDSDGGGATDTGATDTGATDTAGADAAPDMAPDAAPDAPGGNATIRVSGVVYTFNTPDPVDGAVVSLAEYPQLVVTSDAEGRFALEVPDGAPFTPFVTRDGYQTMYHQTFDASGEDFENVFLQFVPLGTYSMLAQLIGVVPAADRCQLVTTASEIAVQGMSYADFAAHGAHGVGGATASAEPPLPTPVYFNEQVFPDPTRTETSDDGGILWTNIEPGIYRIAVAHPTKQFESFTVTCEEGRFINASPPYGARER